MYGHLSGIIHAVGQSDDHIWAYDNGAYIYPCMGICLASYTLGGKSCVIMRVVSDAPRSALGGPNYNSDQALCRPCADLVRPCLEPIQDYSDPSRVYLDPAWILFRPWSDSTKSLFRP